MNQIKTWQERLKFSNGQWPKEECMQDEITELRQAIEQAEQTGHRDFRVPDGWKAERIDEYEIRVVSAEGEAWRLRSADKNDMLNNFIFQWAEAMLSAAPTAPAQPLTDSISWQFKKFREWANDAGYDTAHAHDGVNWICLNPMTADLWKAWQAAHGIKGASL